MTQLKKIIFFALALFFVYGWYFFVHGQQGTPQHAVLGVGSNLLLIKQPDNKAQPILAALDSATKTIDVEVYLLSDKDIIASLINACQRGVTVRVLLEENPFGGGNINQKTKQQLDSSCVKTQWTNPAFPLTHEKTIAIDNSLVFILNQNLTHASFTNNREYDIEDGNTEDVQEIERIFAADWKRSTFHQIDKNLLVSPLSSRSMIESLIQSVSTDLAIEMEVIEDPEVISLLVKKAQQAKIEIILPALTKVSSNKNSAATLEKAGVTVRFLASPYLHAKLLIADGEKAYIGSINFTTQSMDSNREVGIIVSQSDILANLEDSFLSDWNKAGAN